ncbi:MAG: glycosyltransferase family 4 protein [Candidatus Electrothrix sp. GW3-4]|uniref:glycosyltransferase n=1 Tax=Candidatus Electrothrix sp. GW3-4 TaxID=3126740 RepID=UPI0030D15760
MTAFRGHIDGLNTKTIQSAHAVIERESVSKVFVDGSNLGSFVAETKQRLPAVEVVTFFHNVETRFFWGAFCKNKTVHAAGVMVANYLAERKAVRWSDKVICLNQRDSRLLKKLYGRGATHIAPMALEDKLPSSFNHKTEFSDSQPYALFVGGTFYANQTGITWFVREVAPRIDLLIYIVGRGFEALKSELEIPGKVTVVGTVDNLSEWYMRAQFVVAPVFDGSGMKTKVAEALMYGKKVVGTPEAFTGYEDIINQAGWVCSTVDDFVAAIVTAGKEIKTLFYPELREIYQNKYSLNAARVRMKKILEEPI